MSKTGKLRFTLAVKLLVMFLIVVIISSVTIGMVSYRAASKGMTQNVYTQIDTVSNDIVNQISAINERYFQSLHVLAELTMIKDENAGYKALWYLLGLISIVISAFCESSGSSCF